MKLGLDIDDTICDTWQCVMPYMAEYYNIDYEYLKNLNKVYEEALGIDFKEYCRFAKRFYGDIVPNAKLKKDVIEVLTNLKKHNVEIIFITARSNNGFDDPYKTTYDYLINNKVPFDKLIVGCKDKASVCKKNNIDLFIDDSINNCISVSKEGIDALLFETNANKHVKKIKKVKNFKEIEKIVLR